MIQHNRVAGELLGTAREHTARLKQRVEYLAMAIVFEYGKLEKEATDLLAGGDGAVSVGGVFEPRKKPGYKVGLQLTELPETPYFEKQIIHWPPY